MFYRKNLYTWEAVLRIVIGLALIGGSVVIQMDLILRIIVAATGGTLAITGAVGWCPMCALAGRKLKKHEAV